MRIILYEAKQMTQINKLASKNITYYKCPLLKHDCIGNKCMWWIEKGSTMEKKCAITRLAART